MNDGQITPDNTAIRGEIPESLLETYKAERR
jgi:hypothetical protein